MKNTIEVNGIQYVGAREIENHYNLSKWKQWKMMSNSGIEPITIAQSWFYPVNLVEAYMSANLKVRVKKTK